MRRHAIWLTVVAAALAAVALAIPAARLPAPPTPVVLSWPVLALAFLAVESFVVQVPIRGQSHAVSLSEMALVLGLATVAPGELLLAQLIGSAVALVIARVPAHKLAFNLATFAAGTAATALVFHRLVPAADPTGPLGWLATVAGLATGTVLTDVAIFGAISVSEGRAPWRRMPFMLGSSLAATLGNAALALVGVRMLVADPVALTLLLAPTALLLLAYRTYSTAHRQFQRLAFLYRTSGLLHGADTVDEAIAAVLEEVRANLHTGVAELTILRHQGRQWVRWRADASGVTATADLPPDPAEQAFMALMGSSTAPVAGNRDRDDGLGRYLAHRRMADALVAPMRHEGALLGTLLLADRARGERGADGEDAKLLETLANHVVTVLENGQLARSLTKVTQLQDQLRHQAFHDGLTGLGNRALLTDRAARALERGGEETGPGLLFVDLDDFKQVNDTLGHHVGDELLIAATQRLRLLLAPTDLAARLGGDEFAVLVEHANGVGALEELAERMITALHEPFPIAGRVLRVGASVGIALAEPGQQVSELLANADLAMYRAKRGGKGRWATYQPALRDDLLTQV